MSAPLVSRTMQASLGLLTGMLVYGVALGGIFALAFAAVYGRVGHARPRVTAAVLALAGFVVVVLVPFLKYPSNPPAVGADETIGERTRLYFLMLAVSLFAALAALRLGRDFVRRLGRLERRDRRGGRVRRPRRASAQLVMPAIEETPEGFSSRGDLALPRSRRSASTPCCGRRSASGFGALAERLLGPRGARRARRGRRGVTA